MARNIIALIIALIVVGAVFYYISANQATAPEEAGAIPIEAIYKDKVVYTTDASADKAALAKDCTKRGGEFNTCGSVCGPDEGICAEVCAFTCDLNQEESNGKNEFMDVEPEEFTAEIAKLAAVGGYSGDGIATREWDGLAFIHTVTAKLSDPEDNKFYEGWLVIPEAGRFISTGRLEKSGGGYALTYTDETDRSGYYRVVITEETLANGFDDIPEAHVLEGKFGN
jgi:hypothetical protein